jgi:pyruvate formate lyase activating enzyme
MTPTKTLERAWNIAKEKLNYVYLGNIPGHNGENTHCSKCNSLLIERIGYRTKIVGLTGNECSKCGFSLPSLHAE